MIFSIRLAIFVTTVPYLIKAALPGHNVVIDLSHHNRVTSFAKVKTSGIQGVIHKATQGASNNCIDKTYAQRENPALKEGLLWGAYHFGTGHSGVDQANQFLKVVGNNPDILLALDVEPNVKGECGGQITLAVAEDFVRTIYNSRGRYPLIYGPYDFIMNMVQGKNTILRQCPLWVAKYGPLPVMRRNTWPKWTLWQYSDGDVGPKPRFVSGIATNKCDRNTINDAVYPDAQTMWKKAGY